MKIELTPREFRLLLDLVYIGNWVLNSTRGENRFQDYDDLESKIFALSPALSEPWNGTIVPSRAYAEGGIHEAIAYYEDNVFYEILAEELSRRDMNYPEIIKGAGLNGFKKPEPATEPEPAKKTIKTSVIIDGKTYTGTLTEE